MYAKHPLSGNSCIHLLPDFMQLEVSILSQKEPGLKDPEKKQKARIIPLRTPDPAIPELHHQLARLYMQSLKEIDHLLSNRSGHRGLAPNRASASDS